MAAAAEGPGEASSDGEASGKVKAKKAKAEGKGKGKCKEKKSDNGGKAGGAVASGLRKGMCVSAAAGGGSARKGERARVARQSLGNCTEWHCEQLARTPRSTTARPCGMLAVCLLVCVCCGLTYSWRCRRELRAQQGRERDQDGRVEVC